MKKVVNSLIILTCIAFLAVMGCATLMDRLTPTMVNPKAPEYVGQDPQDIYSLYELKIMQDNIAIQHRDRQLELLRLAEDDTNGFKDARGFIEPAVAEANALQEKIIGSDANPLSLSGFLFALTGGLIGRSFFRRPGDLTKEEAVAKGATV
jgi:hypothetical protein